VCVFVLFFLIVNRFIYIMKINSSTLAGNVQLLVFIIIFFDGISFLYNNG
jgi:hypothetical protein